jgi:cobalamin biosynthesis protein CobD/CbiB
MAGVLGVKLIGPIWKDGQCVTERWIGNPKDPEAGNSEDLKKAIWITIDASLMAVLLGMISIHRIWR